MAGTPKLTPLSGEIMASPTPGSARRSPDDVVDAVYETLPRVRTALATPASDASLPGMDTLRGDQPITAMPAAGGPASAAFWLCGATAAALAFWVSGGHAMLRQDGDGVGAIRVASLSTRVDDANGRPSLMVDGTLENTSSAGEVLPDVTINVTAGDGRTLRYRLGVGGRTLEGRESWPFSSRLDAPEGGVRSVTVSLGKDG